MEEALKAGCDLLGGDREKHSMQGKQMSQGLKEDGNLLSLKALAWCGVGGRKGEMAPQIVYY